jgi:hypothetical protein
MMQQWTIIDGQQRLTTLQLLLDALRLEVKAFDDQSATRIEALIANPSAFCSRPEDRFKVWPTNRDRTAFNAAMGTVPTVSHVPAERSEGISDAHRFFREQARAWLSSDSRDEAARARAVETVVRDLLQMVVIDLSAEENAQEIFETLNARGAQLTAADLIKNFIFQRLLESGSNVEEAYERHWKEFETGFWETDISVGRMSYPRSSIFLNHWLIARTGEEVVTREVFARFKRFAYESEVPMRNLLEQIHRAASVYRSFVTNASTLTGSIDRLGLFGYRTGVLESEVIKPFVLYLLDPELDAVPEAQRAKALDAVESWMVRRMLVRATTKSYSQIVAEMITLLTEGNRATAGDAVERFLARQTSAAAYWPDNAEIYNEVQTLLAYRRISRRRLRMVLEAVEDYQRGWKDSKSGLGGERVARGAYAIEHLMPRAWTSHWPLNEGADEVQRDRLVHTIGNLTLLTGRLNSKISNGPWSGEGGKREALQRHDVLLLNRAILNTAADTWSEETIRERSQQLAAAIVSIWPVPENHRSAFSHDNSRPRKKVRLADLINGSVLTPGMVLYPRNKKFIDHLATLLADGRVEVNGVPYASPSEAAVALTGSPTNGWSFFLVDETTRRSLRSVRRDYITDMAVDAEDDDDDDDDDV